MNGQKLLILDHLKVYGSITSMQAFKLYGITRLSGRILDLRNLGYTIDTIMIDGINRYDKHIRYAKYVLKGSE